MPRATILDERARPLKCAICSPFDVVIHGPSRGILAVDKPTRSSNGTKSERNESKAATAPP